MNTTEMRKLISKSRHASHLWVILLTARDRSEGVYLLSLAVERVLLVFEACAEAQEYASLLEAQDYLTDKACRFEGDKLCKFLKASRPSFGLCTLRSAHGTA